MKVRAKKHLGQHFLVDKNIAQKIVKSLRQEEAPIAVLEVGPGMGILSDFMMDGTQYDLRLIDIDKESIAFLKDKYPAKTDEILEGDFLKMDLSLVFPKRDGFQILGNFPYNISSQILFKAVDDIKVITALVGMFQKEVAERIVAKAGTKDYGILSVIMQAYFDVEYLFTVQPGVFNPPPKVKSAVIRCSRKENPEVNPEDDRRFREVVRMAFNQRRKTLRNALRAFITPEISELKIFDLRAERLAVADFVYLVQLFKKNA
jgi:16S rRNA (adenine1518-N6/adenine1519-N6)-dimethyltransferase